MSYDLLEENLPIYKELLDSIKQDVIGFEGSKLMYGQDFNTTKIEQFAVIIPKLLDDVNSKIIADEHLLPFKIALQLHFDRLKRWNNFVKQLSGSNYDDRELIRRMLIIENDICVLEKYIGTKYPV